MTHTHLLVVQCPSAGEEQLVEVTKTSTSGCLQLSSPELVRCSVLEDEGAGCGSCLQNR